MKKAKYYVITLLLAGICVFMYMLLWGKLFPYSPFFLGFNKHELKNTVVYVQEGCDFNNFTRIDSLTASVEKFHELKFKSKPKIFFFKDDESYLKRSIAKARFCAFSSGSLVVSPWAVKEDKQGTISLVIYLRHELSHILIYNYTGLLGVFNYPNWLMEGIAMYSAKQMGTSFYPDKAETYRLIKSGNFMPPEYFKTSKENNLKLNVKFKAAFIYSEFACIVDYMISKYGKDKFIKFMKLLIENNDTGLACRKIYSKSFEDVISDFKKIVFENQ